MSTKEEKRTLIEKLLAPFRVLKIEKFYWFWSISYLISFAGIIIDIFDGNISGVVENGMVFSTCMAVIAPLFIEFVSNYISSNRQKKKEEYTVYKGWTMGVCFVGFAILFLFYVTKMKSSWIAQLISFLSVFAISFYTYLVTKMQTHNVLLEDFKDKTYTELENEEIENMKGNSKKLKNASLTEGVSIKL